MIQPFGASIRSVPECKSISDKVHLEARLEGGESSGVAFMLGKAIQT